MTKIDIKVKFEGQCVNLSNFGLICKFLIADGLLCKNWRVLLVQLCVSRVCPVSLLKLPRQAFEFSALLRGCAREGERGWRRERARPATRKLGHGSPTTPSTPTLKQVGALTVSILTASQQFRSRCFLFLIDPSDYEFVDQIWNSRRCRRL